MNTLTVIFIQAKTNCY